MSWRICTTCLISITENLHHVLDWYYEGSAVTGWCLIQMAPPHAPTAVSSIKCMDGASLQCVFTLTEGVGLTTGVSMIVEMGVADLTTRLG